MCMCVCVCVCIYSIGLLIDRCLEFMFVGVLYDFREVAGT